MGSIFLILEGGQLAEMTESPYESEDLLQELLATYPSLLAGDQFDPTAPRRWLLISREVPLAGEVGGMGRWSVDHVFLDQDSIPTLVEVKRSSDTRIRREVVGQMLDYAANAVVYWPVSAMQEQFERRCLSEESPPLEVFARSLGLSSDEDGAWERFWDQAKLNLEAGRIRMVFLADIIPPELRRIVEFLNGQMNPAQVLAVEVRQYVGQGQRALVPRVIGQTSAAQDKKKSSARPTKRQWDEATFFAELSERQPGNVVDVARRILQWTRSRELDVRWGRGGSVGNFYPTVTQDGRRYDALGVATSGAIEVVFSGLSPNPPFDDESVLRLYHARLNEVIGGLLRESSVRTWQSFPMSVLTNEGTMQQFLDTLEWFFQQVQSS